MTGMPTTVEALDPEERTRVRGGTWSPSFSVRQRGPISPTRIQGSRSRILRYFQGFCSSNGVGPGLVDPQIDAFFASQFGVESGCHCRNLAVQIHSNIGQATFVSRVGLSKARYHARPSLYTMHPSLRLLSSKYQAPYRSCQTNANPLRATACKSPLSPARCPHSQVNSEWYECYKMLHFALDKLPKAGSEDRMLSSLVGVIGGGEDYPESLALTPAASESVSTLIRATEQLLSTGESPRGAVELVEAETCRKVCLEHTGAVRSLMDACGLQRGIWYLEYTLRRA